MQKIIRFIFAALTVTPLAHARPPVSHDRAGAARACQDRLNLLASGRGQKITRGRHRLAATMKAQASLILGRDLGREPDSISTTTNPKVFKSRYEGRDGKSVELFYLANATRVGYVLSSRDATRYVCATGLSL